jgi:putative acetyltransferase
MPPPSPAGISIGPGTDADGAAMAALIAAVFAEYENCPFVAAEFPELAAPATRYGTGGGALFVARDADGNLVGSLAVAPGYRAGDFELFKVYLARSWRGRGLAAHLLSLAMSQARQAGARRLVLWSDTRFLDGHRFYRRHGFRLLPGVRALHDTARSLEFGFERLL